MLALRIAFGAAAALRAVLVYGESTRMLSIPWAAERAERAARALRPERTLPAPANMDAWRGAPSSSSP